MRSSVYGRGLRRTLAPQRARTSLRKIIEYANEKAADIYGGTQTQHRMKQCGSSRPYINRGYEGPARHQDAGIAGVESPSAAKHSPAPALHDRLRSRRRAPDAGRTATAARGHLPVR